MRGGSLSLRLLAAATFSIAAALFVAGLALTTLFEQEVRDRVMRELNNDLLQLIGAIEVSDKGEIKVVRALADHRFETPYGGKYWWIERVTPPAPTPTRALRSRSYWDSEPTSKYSHLGPEGEILIVTEKTIAVASKLGDVSVHLLVGASADEITSPLVKFRSRLAIYLSLIGLALTGAAWTQVTIGLRPLRVIRDQLSLLRTSHAKRLEGEFPTEVEPLINELNDVLNLRDLSLERARRRAGDLAHGLMTPLTVLSAVARDLNKRNLVKQGSTIDSQVENMRKHVERGLVRAHLSSGGGLYSTDLSEAVDAVLLTLRRIPDGREIKWINDVSADTLVPIEHDDLLELLGNLLDNARKFARFEVQISFNGKCLVIEDDGPGVADAELSAVRLRGRRLDKSHRGFGLGLAIVEDIADLYKLRLSLGRSKLGGLHAEIAFPHENV